MGRYKRASPRDTKKYPFESMLQLNYGDINSGGPFCPLLDVEAHPVTFIEGSEALGIDCRVMNEDIRSIFLFDETEALAITEPFNSPTGHTNILLSYSSQSLNLADDAVANGMSFRMKLFRLIQTKLY